MSKFRAWQMVTKAITIECGSSENEGRAGRDGLKEVAGVRCGCRAWCLAGEVDLSFGHHGEPGAGFKKRHTLTFILNKSLLLVFLCRKDHR